MRTIHSKSWDNFMTEFTVYIAETMGGFPILLTVLGYAGKRQLPEYINDRLTYINVFIT